MEICVGGGGGAVHTILIRPITKLQIIEPNCIMNSVLHDIISMSERTLLKVYNFLTLFEANFLLDAPFIHFHFSSLPSDFHDRDKVL